MASAAHPTHPSPTQTTPASPFDRATDPETLRAAWDHVRRSAEASTAAAIRDEARRFAQDADARLAVIARDLRDERFVFAPARGIARPRAGKRPRPIVLAPIGSRVVTRALLEALSAVPAVADACLGAPTSFGGLPGRGVEQAIAAALAAVQGGAAFHVRSDIAEFFRAIPRERALASITGAAGDARLTRLVEQATRTELANLDELGEDGALFPDARIGVAQGNSLSTLLGNVLLGGFDQAMNGRGITCLRYVDDVLFLGPRAAPVKKAFAAATVCLADLGLRAYDPVREPGKAAMGHVAAGVEWLGCEILDGRARPGARSRRALLARVDRALAAVPDGGLSAALVAVEDAVRGFRAAYRFCECPEVFAALDDTVGRRVEHTFRVHRARLAGPRRAVPRPSVKRTA
jgi:hypothetical protein